MGNITLKLDDVPWDEALDFIMMTKDLGKYETGNVTLISPLDRIRTYKEKQRATESVVAALDPLVTEYIKINYASAGSIVALLSGANGQAGACGITTSAATANPTTAANVSTTTSVSGVGGNGPVDGTITRDTQLEVKGLGALSSRGTVAVDARTNTLIVRDTAKSLEEVRNLIHKLDIPVRQVMIESRIVIATNSFVKELGVKFGGARVGVSGSGKGVAVGGAGTRGDIVPTTTTTTGTNNQLGTIGDQLVNLSTAGTPMGALGMTLVRGADYVLNLELQALQAQGKGELISNPRVMTSDRCQATIKQGVQIPYSSATTSGNVSTNTTIFVDAVLELDATPQITPNGSVIMKLNITKNSPGTATPQGLIGIDKREIHTNVNVLDGETVVLGGIFEEVISDHLNSVPFFSDLPGVGFLFKNTRKQDDKTELLIFVTPKIVKDNQASD
jgi:type IV pilus assembly protein PilQ